MNAHHWPLLVVTVAILAVPTACAGALVALRMWERRRPWVLLDILPPEGTGADLKRWNLFFRSLYAISRPWWKRIVLGQPSVIFELWSAGGDLGARCRVPQRLERMVGVLLRSAMPGAQIQPAPETPALGDGPAARSRLKLDREPLHALGDMRPEPLLAVMQALAEAPSAHVQMTVTPDVGWQTRALGQLDAAAGLAPERNLFASTLGWAVDSAFHLVLPSAGEEHRERTRPSRPAPPKAKAWSPGYSTDIRLRVEAPSDGEAKAHMHALVAAFRGFDGANGLRPARTWWPAGPLTLVAEELAGLFHLPVEVAGFEGAHARLAPSRRPSGEGKVICLLEDGRDTPARLGPVDARHHVHVLGPTGAGKSTLLLNLALDDIEAGRGVGIVDPKGDLVRSLMERIRPEHWDRVVLIDPSLRDRPVGLNVLECDDPDLHEVACDQLITIFRKSYERFWGPRTDDILRAAVLTLLLRPGSSLCEVPLLLLQPEARAAITEGIEDPVGLSPFWDEYERTPEGSRMQMVGPVLNKLRSVLLRRTVRNIMGQSRSTIDLGRSMDQGGILLISLAKGLLGEETSRLLGAFLVARLWQAAMARAGRRESERPDFCLYLDEFQNYLHLPQSLDEVLVEARGYRLGLVLAHQHLGQLSAATRDALTANARTRLTFQCGQDDARYMAREFHPWLSDMQLLNLQPHQVAVRLFQDGRTQRPFTGVTRPEPPSLGDDNVAGLIEGALARCGRPRSQVESEIEARLSTYIEPPKDRRESANQRRVARRVGGRATS